MSKQPLICIMCPRGCHLEIDEEMNVIGNHCPRGIAYAKEEVTNPKRYIATTVMITSLTHTRLPVATKTPIAKPLIFALMELLKTIKVTAPIHVGDVVIDHVLGTDVAIVATKSILE